MREYEYVWCIASRWGSCGGSSKSLSSSWGIWKSAVSSPVGFGAEPRPPKGFPLFSTLGICSPDAIILLIVDYYAAIWGEQNPVTPSLRSFWCKVFVNVCCSMTSPVRRCLSQPHRPVWKVWMLGQVLSWYHRQLPTSLLQPSPLHWVSCVLYYYHCYSYYYRQQPLPQSPWLSRRVWAPGL